MPVVTGSSDLQQPEVLHHMLPYVPSSSYLRLYSAYEQKDHEQKQNEKIDPLVYEEDGHVILNTQLLVQRIVEAKLQGADSGRLAYWFHEILAEQITAVCVEARTVSGRQKVALSGGVFQNRLLLRLTEERLTEEGFEVLRHRMIPPNDGGIAIGQAAYGMYQLQK